MAVILATGDIAPDRPDADACFAATSGLLNQADIVFGQLETSFADRGSRLPQARHAVLTAPAAAAAVARAGFDVISMAGNHCMDWGREAFAQTIGALERHGVSIVGAGMDIVEARRAVVRTLPDGTRIAFLAYSSILPMSYWAEERRPGCAPMRAFTAYEPVEPDQPGTAPRVSTFPNEDDLEAMRDDIARAGREADIVLVSMHWGIHFVRAVIADYQREVARAAVAAGANAIIGHHAHILKGVEVIDGAPIIYSLCNFATDLRMDPAHAESRGFREIQALAEEWIPDFDSLYNFPTAARMSMILRLEADEGRLGEVALLPLWIGRDAVPVLLQPADPRFGEVVQYLREVTAEAGLNGRLRPTGDRVLVEDAGH